MTTKIRTLTKEEAAEFDRTIREGAKRRRAEESEKREAAANRKKSMGDRLAGAIRGYVQAETLAVKAELNSHPDLNRYRLDASARETEMRELLNELNDRLRQLEFHHTKLC